MLKVINNQSWKDAFDHRTQLESVEELEQGHILFFPHLAFPVSSEEAHFLPPEYLHPHYKNISYQPQNKKLWGAQRLTDKQHAKLKKMMERYSKQTEQLINALLPEYVSQITTCRTSLRPMQVCNRKCSYRKDDKRLHVDAFPSAPNHGQRILRVFSNLNPHGEDLIWRIGEPFKQVAEKFLPEVSRPFPGAASLLRLLKITKSRRTVYDHYMLQLHNKMKADMDYQIKARQQEVRFPPGTTWISLTDQVSYAAMKGQHVIEQTFYLPVSAMKHPELSPLYILEDLLHKKLA